MARTFTLKQSIDRLRQRRAILRDEERFFRLHAPGWQRIAMNAVRVHGRVLRPAEISREQWELYLEELVALVGMIFVDPDADGAGVDIDLAVSGERGRDRKGNAPVTMADVLAWVTAGAEGEELGKRLTEAEKAMPPEEVASRVWFARARGKAKKLDRPIREYLDYSETQAGANILDALLKAWVVELRPVILRQWREYIADVARLDE